MTGRIRLQCQLIACASKSLDFVADRQRSSPFSMCIHVYTVTDDRRP